MCLKRICQWLCNWCSGGGAGGVGTHGAPWPAAYTPLPYYSIYLRSKRDKMDPDSTRDLTDAELEASLQAALKPTLSNLGILETPELRRMFTMDSRRLDRLIAYAGKNAERNGVRGYVGLPYANLYYMPAPRRIDSRYSLEALRVSVQDWANRFDGTVALEYPPRVSYSGPTTRYLDGANSNPTNQNPVRGINAHTLHAKGIKGAGQSIADLEFAWWWPTADKRVVKAPSKKPRWENETYAAHGTATIGVVSGWGDLGIGIAPEATFIKAPILGSASESQPSYTLVAEVIAEVADAMLFGASEGSDPINPPGVILIELEEKDTGNPMEVSAWVHDAIRTAVAAGHIVVESAGNGWPNDYDPPRPLDQVDGNYFSASPSPANPNPVVLPRKLRRLSGGDDSAMDSCAILVAAGGSGEGDPYGELFPSLGNRIISSNFGSIIDTWAWGDSIMSAIARVDSTTGAKTLVAGGSSETSGASAVIAGAILLMQQLRQSRGLQPLQYPDLRTHFANPLLGTVGVGDLSAVVMPDLAKLEPVIAPPQQPPIN